MLRIAVDAMGGDHAPFEIVRGAVTAMNNKKDLQLFLVGREERIREALRGLTYAADRLSVRHAGEVIHGDDDPGLAIRRKKESSMVVTMQMLREGAVDAALSAGNTGALMAGALLFLGRLSGISRPALLTVMPSFTGQPAIVLDVGANMDARPEQLVQYALMGRIYSQQLMDRPEPRVALLNVGTEPNKGNSQVKKAHLLFSKHVPGFSGNIEGTGIFTGAADVVVCDGFVGNILLKISEGIFHGTIGYLKDKFSENTRNRLGAALIMPVMRGLKEQVDDSEYGGAPLVGVKGVCIKCHGSSRARSIEQAILRQAYPLVENSVQELFQQAFLENPALVKGAKDEKQRQG